MDTQSIQEAAKALSQSAVELSGKATVLAAQAAAAAQSASGVQVHDFWYLAIIFVLACFIGFYVVWSVTPALHSPLMGVTNAISSVIIVGALIAAGPVDMSSSGVLGFFAVMLASINIFGGFIVTQRMLQMFRKKDR